MFWTVILSIICVLVALFAVVYIIALINKPKTVFADKPEEKNPVEGKKVEFVEDDRDDCNADGVRGHLVIVGNSEIKESFYANYVKRILDLIISFFGLVILSPLFLIITLAIYFDDPGPIFFTQKRVGKNKKFFKLHKFRSMKMSTPHDKPTHMLENPEQYITKVGKFIRAHSLDEIPQIWDIFIGNMSIVGPRPALWNQYFLTAERDKYGANEIKPGLTGWAQINGRDTLEIPEKAKLDGEYAAKQSFCIDAKCFFGTVSKVKGDSSVVEGNTKKEMEAVNK
ncbi:MAG: sugar transferase [Clostridiales bacterium]|nr:sugar transferase [Candidatus Equinaster intestinalis]